MNLDSLKRLSGFIAVLLLLLALAWNLSTFDGPKQPVIAKIKSESVAPPKRPERSFILDRAKKRLEEIDKREAQATAPSTSRVKDLAALRREIPGVQVDFDAITGAPSHIMAAGRFLTQAKPGAKDPDDAVRDFVSKYEALFGHGKTALDAGQSRVTREDVTAHNGMRTVVWQQEVAGVPVFQTILKANLTKNGDLVTLGSHFMGDPIQAAGEQVKLVAQPPLDAGDAMAHVATNLGGDLQKAAVTSTPMSQGAEKAQKLTAPGYSDTTAHLSWVPMNENTLRLAWQVETFSLQQNEMFRVLVDAEEGTVLVRQSITTDISNASYRVYAKPNFQPYDSPTPFAPGYNTPSGIQPAEVSRNLVTLDAVNTTASPNGWINDGGTQTLGNNVDAHTDIDANNVADLPRPTSATRNFDFTLNLTQDPSTYRDAAVTNLFYLCNYIHDRLYSLGFTESAGNFQTNNFGRGGNGNDAVQADAQDGSGTNNANFSTPSDGSPGRMQMYVFTGPTPYRDGDLDHEIVIHEYAHGLSNRLVGGGVGIYQNQTQGMGEGWSDFYGMCLLSEATDDPNGNYAAGGYATKNFYGLTDNYYFGIRRYPYSTNLLKNPLTFKDIDPSQASSHTGIVRNSVVGTTANEVHNEGEVWCVTLWDMRANLIAKHGWATGNQLALQITTDAMKLCPANPNMLQSRDAIIQADLVSNGGDNRSELWSAFAKRGMGASASSPASSTTTGLVEAYDFPDYLSVTPLTGLAATGITGGPFTPESQTFTLTNTGPSPLNWTASKTQPWTALSATSGTLAAGGNTTVAVSFSSAANGLPPGSYTDNVSFTNLGSGAVISRSAKLTVDAYTIVVFNEPFATATPGANWTFTGTNTYRTQVTSASIPNSGSYHLTMDSSVDDSYSRNEATLTLNLSGRQHVRLSFWAKGFSDEGDGPPPAPFPSTGANFDGVAISADGGNNWYEVQGLRAISGTYTKYVVDLDPVMTAYGLSYGANFKFRFNQYDNYAISTDGIAIDDIVVSETVNNTLALSLAEAATEGDAPVTATLSVTPTPSADLLVNLTSSTVDASVPATMMVPAGSGSVTFPVTVYDDTVLDGTQTVTINATALSYLTSSRTLMVHDNETATLALAIPSNAIEGSSPPQASVSVSEPVAKAVTVVLVSDNASAQVPASVTIPAGQTSALFSLSLPNDNLINGSRNATISATVQNWVPGSASVTVLDDEVAAITLSLNAETHESAGATAAVGTVTLGGTAMTPVTVALTSSDTSELTLPATITIPAGQNSAPVVASIVDDTDLDGTQTVTVSASALGNPAVTRDIAVRDNDAASFTLSAVPSPQREGAGFPFTITALDVNGLTLPAVAGPVTQTATGDAGAVSYNYPAANFVNGVWQQPVRVMVPATNVVITVTGPQATAQSNAFDVTAGPRISVAPSSFTLDIPRQSSKTRTLTITNNGLGTMTWSAAGSKTWLTCVPANGNVEQGQSATVNVTFNAATLTEGTSTAQLNITSNDYTNPAVPVAVTLNVTAPAASFVWDTVPSPQRVNAPFPVTVTAKDAGGAIVTGFEGPAGLSAFTGTSSATTVKVVSFTRYADAATEYPNTKAAISSYFTDYVETSFSDTSVAALTAALAGKHVLLIPEQESSTLAQMQALGTAWSSTLNTFVAQGGTVIVCSNSANEEQLFSQSGLMNVTKSASPTTATLENASSTFLNAGVTPPITNQWLSTYSTITNGEVSIRVQATNNPVVLHRTVGLGRVILIGTDYFTTGTSMDRVVANAVASSGPQNTPQLLTPVQTDVFVNGRWTGNVTAGTTFSNGWLRASQGGTTGDSNGFDVNADGTLAITLTSATTRENAGTLDGTVTISPAAAADVLVTLSSSVAGAAVPAAGTITIPAGSTSAAFTLNIIDDAVIDGPQTTQIRAVSAGYVAASAALIVADDEGAVLTINLPAESYSENAGTVSGTITSSEASATNVTVQLASNDPSEATLPASVTLPAGATSVPFSLTVVDDTLLDGPQTVVLTASVAGWASGMKTVTVTDNELRKLAINGVPASISEGAATLSTPTLSLPGQTMEAVVVTLTSSDPTALPSVTVTIPAGASSAAFDLDPVDDLLLDGTQTVTLTASAPSFSGDSVNVAVLDDDVHHFALSTIPSPQQEGIGFAFTATAKDINDVTISAAVGGPVNLTAAGDAGAISVLPAVLTPLTTGVWTGNVRVMGPGTNVKLTVASPTATTQSNAFDVNVGPHLEVNPSSYALSVAQNTSKVRTLMLNNTGVAPLTWSLSPSYVLNAALGLVFNGVSTPLSKEQAAAQPSPLWSQPRTSNDSAAVSAAPARTLEDCKAQINARYAEITELIPSRYDFADGVTGTSISDGGNDMYDTGNSLNTNLGSYIPYSDNVIASPASSLGAGGRYFTRKQPGLFLFVADVASISSFSITGNLGADGSGSTDGAVLTASRGGMNFKGFVKRVYNAGDPSVNHLVIVADNGSAAHSYATYTDDDQHTVTGLAGVTRVYYLLYAGQGGGYINDAQTLAIFSKFIDIVEVSNWLTATPVGGTIAPGGSAPVEVSFNAAGMPTGVYQGSLQINSNDGLQPQYTIPATMTVTPGIHHFDWDTLPSPQVVNAPVAATIRAKDSANNPVVNFEGMAALTALNTATSGETTIGAGTGTTSVILDTSYSVHRTQSIYTPAEAGAAGRLSGLALDVATVGSPAASNFTIRLKHTSRVNYSTDTSWEGSGWTVVYSGSKTLAAGLNYFTFATPFDYNGSSNLMVDISFTNSTYSSASYCRYTTSSPSRTIYYGSYSGDPLTWNGTSTYAYTTTAQPNLRLVKSGSPALISPAVTGAFVNGAWTGDVRLGAVGTLALTATAGGVTGTSNAVTTTSTGATLSLTMPSSVTEGQGTFIGAGTVSVSSPPAAPLTISLESLDTSELSLPASVILPAGQSSVTFNVTAVDDLLLDGPATVQSRAVATGYPTAAATTTVADNETTTLTLTLPASLTEAATTTQGTVQLGTTATENLTVVLASSLASRVSVPATVVIPAGSSSATFAITTPNNSIIDGTQTATITATLAGSVPGTGTTQIIDNESTNLTLYLAYSSVSEGAVPLTSAGYVYLSGTVVNALTITLTSNDTTELTVPATITIPAGSSQSNYFTLTPVNDALKDGSQTVTVSAAASGFTSASQNVTVLDDDVHHFAMTAVPSSLVRNAAFSVTFTAQDVNNVTIASYAGTPALAAADGATALSITPATLTGFSSGTKTQSISIGTYATNAVITVTDAAAAASGTSNAFSVGYGAHSQFVWSAIGGQQSPGVPISTTVTAQDALGNTITGFSSTADIQGVVISGEAVIGAGTSTSIKPLDTSYDGARSQMIFLPGELGGARLLTGMTLNVMTIPNLPMSRFAIRLKHTATASYPSSVSFDNTGLVTVYSSASETISSTGLKTFHFNTPFSYDGTQNLLVDIVFDNASASSGGYCQTTTTSPSRHLYASNWRSLGYGDPYAWTSANNLTTTALPNVKFLYGTTLAVTPATTGAFSAGVWTGSVTVPTSVSNIRLQASSGAASGLSNLFSTAPPYLSVTLPASAVESAGTVSGTVSINLAQASALTVNLSSNDTTEAQPATTTVTIPAGSTSVNFTLNIINDTLRDGAQNAIIAASAAGMTSGSATISVTDNDVDNFLISAVGAQVRNTSFSVTFTARDVNNVTIPTYAGTPTLSARDGATSLTITPTTLSGFSSGTKTQSISIGSYATSAVITATDSTTGGTGSSNAFAVAAGAVDHFGISAVPATIPNGSVQAVTVTAQDAVNNTVASFTQTANLSISNDSAAVTSGTGTSTWSLPLGSLNRTQRMQLIYLPSEVGTARVLNNLALYVGTVPGSALSNFTIRMKHTSLTSYSTVAWDSTGWTTVYQGATTISATGWKQFDFATPFTYDGTSSLMIDFSYYNAAVGITQGYTQYTSSGTLRTVLLQTDIDYGSPLTWTGTTNPTPLSSTVMANVRFGTTGVTVPVSPTITGSFTNGVWSGTFTPANTATAVRFRAANGSITGASNAFSIIPPALSISLPASASESAGSVAGTVSIPAALASALTVNLSSNDATEAQPATSTVTIPAGATSVGFTLNIFNDTLRDGAQNAVITASASGLTSGTATISVTDNDVDNFLVSAVSSQVRNAPFGVTFTARDVNNVVITNYSGTPVLTAVDGATSLTVSPTTVSGFSSGTRSPSVTVSSYASNAVLTLTDPVTGGKGSSNSFSVTYTTAAKYAWSTIAQPAAGVPFAATLTAQDKYGNNVGNYTGTAGITVMKATKTGTGATSWSYPLGHNSFSNRVQVISTAAELGAAKTFSSLSLNVLSLGDSANLGTLTVRMKHTSKSSYSGSAAFETTGWTTCYQGSTAAFPGWNTFSFTTPFSYDGVQNVLVDMSLTTSVIPASAPVSATDAGAPLSVFSTGPSGDPLLWSYAGVTSTLRPDFILGSDAGFSPSPSTTGAFTAGVWTGNVTLSSQASNLMMRAVAGSVSGISNIFNTSVPQLSITVPATASESAGSVSGTVSLSAALASALTVDLSSNDTSEAQPATTTVTIPAGSTSAGFTLNIINDTLRDGVQNAVITASAPGANSGTATISVTDDDVDNFLVSAVGAQVRNAPFTVTFTARDVNNTVLTGYNGSPVLTALDGATSLTVSPTTVSGFSSGVKSQSVTMPSFASNAVLTLTDSTTGGKGSSDSFVVTFGAVSKFAWSTINSPQVLNAAFPVSVTAQDAAGNTVTSYSSTAALSSANAFTQNVGDGSVTNNVIPFNSTFSKCRSQQVLLASEIGAAGQITSLALKLTSVPVASTFTDFTIRLKHTSRTGYSGTSDFIWENTGFTVAYQSSPVINAPGYVTFTFSTPFNYDGVSNLMVDYSYRATPYNANRPAIASTTRSNARSINFYTNVTTYGEPLTWSGSSPAAYYENRTADIQLGIGTYYPLTPTTTPAFTNGVWAGNLTVGSTSNLIAVTATDGGLTGTSNNFEVLLTAFALAAEPAFTGGLTNALTWNQPATGLEYEVQRSATPDFAAPVSSGYITGSASTFTALADGQTYYYRARMRRQGALSWTSDWTPQISSTQDATAPVLSIPALTTSSASATLSGTTQDTTSGISSVMVAGEAATTSDSFATWTKTVPSLVDGSNSITVTANDNASPPNSATVTAIIYRVTSVTGDSDNNGISNLLEHALGIPAGTANPRAMLPAATLQSEPGTGDKYLTMQFRRRIQRAGISYTIETSSNLATWDNTGASVQEVGTVPTGDGTTEVVTIRVTPAMSGANPTKFVRLSVTTH